MWRLSPNVSTTATASCSPIQPPLTSNYDINEIHTFVSWKDSRWRSFTEMQQPCFIIVISNIQSLYLDLKPIRNVIFNSHIYFRQLTDSSPSAGHFEQMLALPFCVCETFFCICICICSWLEYNLKSELVCLWSTCSVTPALLNSLITLSICAWISLRALKNPSAGL